MSDNPRWAGHSRPRTVTTLGQPVTHTQIDVADCQMSATFVFGDEEWEYLFRLGAPLERAMLQFTPPALRRFVHLASDLMAVSLPQQATPVSELPTLMSPPLPAPERLQSELTVEEVAHHDSVLMAEVSQVNTLLSRYLLRVLDADAGRASELSPDDERALADRVAAVAVELRARAARRAQHGEPSDLID